MRGQLNQDCLPDVLRQIYLERRSGCLRLTQDHTRKEIFFELGAMVFASSNRREDRIGESMLRHSTISQEQFDLAQAHMGRGKRFGKILVDLKIISERDLIANVTFQVLDIIYSVFNWTVGSYEFYEVGKTISEDLKLDLSTASIILEGVRRISDIDVIERGLGDLNRLVGPSTNPLLRLQTLSLRPLERQIIDVIREPLSLIKLLVKVKSPAETVLRSLYGLLSAGVLERFAPAELSQESGKMEVPEKVVRQTLGMGEPVPVVVASNRQTGAHKVDEMALRRRIDLVKARMKDGDVYQLFAINPGCELEELQSAYYKLAREFHPDRHLSATKELRSEIDELFTQLTSLYDQARNLVMVETTAMPVPTGVTGPIRRNTAPQPLENLPPTPAQKQSATGKFANVEASPVQTPVIAQTLGHHSTKPLPSFEESLNTDTTEDAVLEDETLSLGTGSLASNSKPFSPTGNKLAVSELDIKLKQTILDAPAITQSLEIAKEVDSPTEALVNTSEAEALMDALDELSQLSTPVVEEENYSSMTEPLALSSESQVLESPVAPTTVMSENTRMVQEALSTTALDNLSTEEVMMNLSEMESATTSPLSMVETTPVLDEQEQAEQLFVVGRNAFQSKDVGGAVKNLREAVKLSPRQTRYRLLLGHVLSNNQRWQKEAEEQFNQVLDIEPQNVMAHLGLAQLYSKVGLVRRAENEFREALKIEPQNPVAKKGLKAITGDDTLGVPSFLTKLLPSNN